MPRPRKCRRVCQYPAAMAFLPEEPGGGEDVRLTMDEYETIRLIDREGLSQEQCGERMGVARTTVQQIYAIARKKLADALTEGRALRIGGGDVELCRGEVCACSACFRRELSREYTLPKGDNTMRIAIPYENGEIFQHFGRTERFKVYDVQDGKVVSGRVVDTHGTGHSALAGMLQVLGVDALICGGIGGGARAALSAAGIALYGGVTGDADRAAEALAAGALSYDPEKVCDHHGDHHGGSCGEHGCGEHGCGEHTCK